MKKLFKILGWYSLITWCAYGFTHGLAQTMELIYLKDHIKKGDIDGDASEIKFVPAWVLTWQNIKRYVNVTKKLLSE